MSPHPVSDALPERYNRDYLIVLVQDPTKVYVYWEITPQRLYLAADYLGKAARDLPLAVRLLRGDPGNPVEVARQSVSDTCGHCYFSGLQPDQVYFAELGTSQTKNGFLALLCSQQTDILRLAGNKDITPEKVPPVFPSPYFFRS